MWVCALITGGEVLRDVGSPGMKELLSVTRVPSLAPYGRSNGSFFHTKTPGTGAAHLITLLRLKTDGMFTVTGKFSLINTTSIYKRKLCWVLYFPNYLVSFISDLYLWMLWKHWNIYWKVNYSCFLPVFFQITSAETFLCSHLFLATISCSLLCCCRFLCLSVISV